MQIAAAQSTQMLSLHNLSPALGSVKKRKRIARGGARGRKSGRGDNGAKSRSGYSSKRGFEGGQMPLHRRIPKIGFNNSVYRVEYKPINLYVIEKLVSEKKYSVIDRNVLLDNGLISKSDKYKILSDGELSVKGVKIFAHAFSMQAKSKIEKVGGLVEIIAKSSLL